MVVFNANIFKVSPQPFVAVYTKISVCEFIENTDGLYIPVELFKILPAEFVQVHVPPSGVALVNGTNGALVGQVVAVLGETFISFTLIANVAEHPVANE